MKPNSIPSAGTNAEQRTDVEDNNVSPFFAKPNVSRSPSQQLLDLCKNNRVAFLENGDYLDEDSETVFKYLFENGIDCTAICKVEEQGLESVLRQCRDKNVIIFQTTWTYSVSQELKKAFMSIQNLEFKKTFIEIFVSEPTFSRVPKGVIHNIYAFFNS